MNKQEYETMKNELKKEFSKLFESQKFNSIVDILKKYYPAGNAAETSAQVLVVSEFIESNEKRGEFDPICTFSVSSDKDGKYSDVAFGIIPGGVLSAKIRKP